MLCSGGAVKGAGRMARLIIVEDNTELAFLIVSAARARGHVATAMAMGQAALQALSGGAAFDAAVVDLLLPDTGGGEVLDALRNAGIPAVAMSGVYKGEKFAREAMERHGAVQFFEKPFDMRSLLEAVEGAAAGAEALPAMLIEDEEDEAGELEELTPLEEVEVDVEEDEPIARVDPSELAAAMEAMEVAEAPAVPGDEPQARPEMVPELDEEPGTPTRPLDEGDLAALAQMTSEEETAEVEEEIPTRVSVPPMELRLTSRTEDEVAQALEMLEAIEAPMSTVEAAAAVEEKPPPAPRPARGPGGAIGMAHELAVRVSHRPPEKVAPLHETEMGRELESLTAAESDPAAPPVGEPVDTAEAALDALGAAPPEAADMVVESGESPDTTDAALAGLADAAEPPVSSEPPDTADAALAGLAEAFPSGEAADAAPAGPGDASQTPPDTETSFTSPAEEPPSSAAAPESPFAGEPPNTALTDPPTNVAAAPDASPTASELSTGDIASDAQPQTDPVFVPFGERGRVWHQPEHPVRGRPLPEWGEAGDLSQSPVPKLLNAFYAARHTGELKLKQDTVVKVITVENGLPVYAASNLAAERFGRFCVRRGAINEDDLNRVAALAELEGIRTGESMVRLGLVTEDRRRELLEEQVREIIYSTFGWTRGQYHLVPKKPSRQDLVKLFLFPGELILEGVTRTHTLISLRQKMPPARRLSPAPDPPYTLQEIPLTGPQQALLAAADGSKTVEDLLSLTDLSEREALASLAGFELLGLLVERREESKRQRISFGL